MTRATSIERKQRTTAPKVETPHLLKMSLSGRTSMQNISRPSTTPRRAVNENATLSNGSSVTISATNHVLPRPTKYVPTGTIANTPFRASLISWALGGVFWTSVLGGVAALCLREGWIRGITVEMIFGDGRWTRCIRPQLGFYLASWSLFHILEFWTTAACNVEKLSVDGKPDFVRKLARYQLMCFSPCCSAFLLNNGLQYHAAHIIGLLEYFITAFLVNENASNANDVMLFRRCWMGYGSLVIGGCFYIFTHVRAADLAFALARSFTARLRRTSFTFPRHDPCRGLILARCQPDEG